MARKYTRALEVKLYNSVTSLRNDGNSISQSIRIVMQDNPDLAIYKFEPLRAKYRELYSRYKGKYVKEITMNNLNTNSTSKVIVPTEAEPKKTKQSTFKRFVGWFLSWFE